MTFDECIQEKCLKLREVADQLDISVSMVWHLRRGKATPSIAVARRVYDWSDGRVNFLVGTGDGAEEGEA